MMYTPLQLADAFLHAGELDEALTALNEHLTAQPSDDEARRLRSQIYAGLGTQSSGAQGADYFRAALTDLDALASSTADDVIRRAHVLEQLGDPDRAHAYLHELWKHGDKVGHDARVVERLLEGLQRRHDAVTALDILFDQPKTWRWLRWTGDFHALKGDHRVALDYYCSALDQLAEATENAPTSAAGFFENMRVQLLLRRGDMYQHIALYAEAAADYADAEASIPDDAMIAFKRGVALFMGGDQAGGAALCADAMRRAKPDSQREAMVTLLDNNPHYAPLAERLAV